VLDFDTFPAKPEDQLPLLQFRLKKILPYDIDSAAISYVTQPLNKFGKHEVVAVATPLEVVARYEAPFRAANVHAGVVTISHLAMLDLVPPQGVTIVAKLSGDLITVMAVENGVLRLARSLELSERTLDEIAADLYPTFAYCEDSLGSRPEAIPTPAVPERRHRRLPSVAQTPGSRRMRIPINLASQPFRHDRALLLGSAVLAVVMLGTLIMLISLARTDSKQKRESAKQLVEARQQLTLVRKDLATVEKELRQPRNEAVLETSTLLNDILLRKGISWTRIFSDLEKVIPYNVQVLQIRPQVDKNNRIYLQMVLGADQPAQITACIEKLEGSEVFGATRVTTIVPPSQTDPLFRYQVTVIYAQKL
jgi:hypothetical protein